MDCRSKVVRWHKRFEAAEGGGRSCALSVGCWCRRFRRVRNGVRLRRRGLRRAGNDGAGCGEEEG